MLATESLSPTRPQAVPGGKGERLTSVDLLRGMAMVLMALDHVRDYFSNSHFDPGDLSRASPALFLTRWSTHGCAPAFFFLAGMGAFLSGARGKPKVAQARFLLSRGAFLILLEFTVVRFGWTFNLDYGSGPWLGVIWALGVSMIVLGGLIFLPSGWIAGMGLVMIATHNLADGVSAAQLGPVWAVLHERGPIQPGGIPFYVSYPLIPWVGVMALGYPCGPLLQGDRPARRWRLLALGIVLSVAFIVIRAVNIYGDAQPWTAAGAGLYPLLSFLNTTKYPPSLLFLLMTLGPALMALAWFDGPAGPIARSCILIGRVPLFFYILHLYVIHGLALAAGTLQGFEIREFCVFYEDFPANYGFDLPMVYLVWMLIILLLYPLCVWFADLKKRPGSWWLSYL